MQRIEDLETILTFKTLRCRNPYHYKQSSQTLQYKGNDPSETAEAQSQINTSSDAKSLDSDAEESTINLCRFFHRESDRRRPLLSHLAIKKAQSLSNQLVEEQ